MVGLTGLSMLALPKGLLTSVWIESPYIDADWKHTRFRNAFVDIHIAVVEYYIKPNLD